MGGSALKSAITSPMVASACWISALCILANSPEEEIRIRFFHFYPLSPIIFHFHSASPSPSPGQPGYFLPFAGGDPQAPGGRRRFYKGGGPFGPRPL